MSDMALKWNGSRADLDFGEFDINSDDSLKTTIILCVFTDKRHEGERGCWTDSFEDEEIGSKLWLIDREKKMADVPLRANEYVKDSLQWLIRDGVIKSVKVDSFIDDQNLLQIPIWITKPNGSTSKFDLVWEGLKK
jgi:phage gp46-like protein